MTGPIAFCPTHGFFSPGVIRIGAGAKVQIGANVSVNCPASGCSKAAEMLPGSYEMGLDNRLNFLADPSISSEGLAALRDIAARAGRNEITAEQAKAEATVVAPKAGKLFDVVSWPPEAKAALYAAVIAAIATMAKCDGHPTVIINNQPVIERVIPRQSPLPGLPGGTPWKPEKV